MSIFIGFDFLLWVVSSELRHWFELGIEYSEPEMSENAKRLYS